MFLVRDNRAIRSRVITGQRTQGWVEIVEGVPADADVIVAGLQQVRDGAPVRIANQPPAARPPAGAAPAAANPPANATQRPAG